MDTQTYALAESLKRRIEEVYREEVAARGEAEAQLASTHHTGGGSYDTSLVVVAIERVRRCEDARRQVAALLTTLGGL